MQHERDISGHRTRRTRRASRRVQRPAFLCSQLLVAKEVSHKSLNTITLCLSGFIHTVNMTVVAQRNAAFHAAKAALRALSGTGAAGQVSLRVAGPVALLLLSNPSRANALSCSMMLQFSEAVDELSQLQDVAAVVVAGDQGGRAFCAGADLRGGDQFFQPSAGAAMNLIMADATTRLLALPVVSVAAIHRAAVGGGAEMALAADYRVIDGPATDTAAAAATATAPTAAAAGGAGGGYLQFVHAQRGLIPGWQGVQRLVSTCGRAAALRLLTSSARVGAAEALRLGLVDAVDSAGAQPAALPLPRDWEAASPMVGPALRFLESVLPVLPAVPAAVPATTNAVGNGGTIPRVAVLRAAKQAVASASDPVSAAATAAVTAHLQRQRQRQRTTNDVPADSSSSNISSETEATAVDSTVVEAVSVSEGALFRRLWGGPDQMAAVAAVFNSSSKVTK